MTNELRKIISGKAKILSIELLALISSASVLRNEKIFRELLIYAGQKRISGLKIYEAVLQTYLFAGFPSALVSLSILKEYFKIPKNYSNKRGKHDYKKEGELTCRRIYGDKFEKLISNTKEFSPELSEWLIVEGYGKVLTRKGLPLKERELIIIAVLTALKFRNQLYSHINGAFRLKIKLSLVRKIILNLNFISRRNSALFGIRVLTDFIKQKNLRSK